MRGRAAQGDSMKRADWNWNAAPVPSGCVFHGRAGNLRGTIRRVTADEWEAVAWEHGKPEAAVTVRVPNADAGLDFVESYEPKGMPK